MINSTNVLTRAILWVSHPQLLWQRVGGISVLERQLFTLERAGLRSVFVALTEPDEAQLAALRLPRGLEVRWVTRAEKTFIECEPPYLGLSAEHLVRVETVAFIAGQNVVTSVSYDDASGLSVVSVVDARDNALGKPKQPLPDGSYKRLEAPLNQDSIIDWILVAGPKSQDGFMARHFDRHLSLAMSRVLLDSAVTPNQMTLLSTIIGLVGASFFLGDSRLSYVLGAGLIWLHSVLDGCDGELSRARFQESSFGADLDFWGDNLVHLALFTCLGMGFYISGRKHAVLLAVAADMSVLASAVTAWRRRRARRAVGGLDPETGVVDEPAGDGVKSRFARLENTLAQRDFIYLLVLLAFMDRMYEFLWAAAIGGFLYFATMLYLEKVNKNEQAR